MFKVPRRVLSPIAPHGDHWPLFDNRWNTMNSFANHSLRKLTKDNVYCAARQYRVRTRSARAFQNAMLSSALFAAFSAGADRGSAALTIEALGFKNETGHAVAKLFMPGDDVLKRGRWEVSDIVQAGRATLTFPAVAPGSYALVIFHDRNKNGSIDHNIFGIPNEPLGFSNGYAITLTSGLPTFEKLRFRQGALAQTLFIKTE
jgi:uncharacterized protein (DUF2141 family)